MSRYIDADIALEIIDRYRNTTDENGKIIADAIIDIIKTITPTADVVEVVRCKDCRMAEEDLMIDGWYYCSHNELTHNPEHFCSYGERKR